MLREQSTHRCCWSFSKWVGVEMSLGSRFWDSHLWFSVLIPIYDILLQYSSREVHVSWLTAGKHSMSPDNHTRKEREAN